MRLSSVLCDTRPPVIALLGPTASGKTALAIALAERFDGEIISCDSMQIYRGMDIATAKPTAEERARVPHHLIDFLPVDSSFSVSDFVARATEAASDIRSRGRTVFLCGGTGLYADAFLSGMSFPTLEGTAQTRAELEEFFRREGLEALQNRLLRLDPDAPKEIDLANPKRVLRAIEICECSGLPLRVYRERNRSGSSPYRVLSLCLDFRDRDALYRRIDRRTDEMIKGGLLEEARNYYALSERCTASQAIGYKELKLYFDGSSDLPHAVEQIKKATRHYAKRQLTWFRKNRVGTVRYLYADEPDTEQKAYSLCEAFLKGEDLNANT